MTEPGLLTGRVEEAYWTCPWCRREMATPQQVMKSGRSYQADFSKRFHLDECEKGGKGKSLNDAKVEQLRLGIGKQQTLKQRGYRPGVMGLISKTSQISLEKRKEKVQRRARAIKARPAASTGNANKRRLNIKEREEGDLIIQTEEGEEIYRKKKSECDFTFEILFRKLDDKALEERRQWANRKLRIWLKTTELQNTKCKREWARKGDTKERTQVNPRAAGGIVKNLLWLHGDVYWIIEILPGPIMQQGGTRKEEIEVLRRKMMEGRQMEMKLAAGRKGKEEAVS